MILSIDQGTTGTTSVIYNLKGEIEAKAYKEFNQYYPKPGWVEHDPIEIWQTVLDNFKQLPGELLTKVKAIGITNQRETTILWDKKTGKPIHNAIVWQCRRTTDLCEMISDSADMVKQKTGLPIDAYFSGTKIKWLLDNAKIHNAEDVLFGTIDTWLIWKLTGGKTHATDYTNASRTMIFNIHEKKWDPELCELLGIPMHILPEVKKSIDDYGQVSSDYPLANKPIYAVAGDQQAALFGQCCFDKGQVKNTYGTGCFVVMNTGDDSVETDKLVTTLACDGEGNPCYALEGSIFIGGAAIQWLRDELQIVEKASDSEKAAISVDDNGGVYLVPAFVGLGAPYWNMEVRGSITGLTRGANRNHIIRAALESMCYQTYDVIEVMKNELGIEIDSLSVDGGAVANDFLMQFQADMLNTKVLRPKVIESTSQGVAFMAGLKAGVWKDSAELLSMKRYEKEFIPSMGDDYRRAYLRGWKEAISKTIASS